MKSSKNIIIYSADRYAAAFYQKYYKGEIGPCNFLCFEAMDDLTEAILDLSIDAVLMISKTSMGGPVADQDIKKLDDWLVEVKSDIGIVVAPERSISSRCFELEQAVYSNDQLHSAIEQAFTYKHVA